MKKLITIITLSLALVASVFAERLVKVDTVVKAPSNSKDIEKQLDFSKGEETTFDELYQDLKVYSIIKMGCVHYGEQNNGEVIMFYINMGGHQVVKAYKVVE
jgi:hypothetical protein